MYTTRWYETPTQHLYRPLADHEPVLYPTHLVAGYLVGRVGTLSVAAVVAGTALPDLIDKPLGVIGIAAQYHTVAHSALSLVVLGVLATRGRVWLAVAVGWGSHLALDALHMVLNGRPADVQFLLWPVVEHEPQVSQPPVEWALSYLGSPSSLAELAIWLAALTLFLRSGETDSRRSLS